VPLRSAAICTSSARSARPRRPRVGQFHSRRRVGFLRPTHNLRWTTATWCGSRPSLRRRAAEQGHLPPHRQGNLSRGHDGRRAGQGRVDAPRESATSTAGLSRGPRAPNRSDRPTSRRRFSAATSSSRPTATAAKPLALDPSPKLEAARNPWKISRTPPVPVSVIEP